MKKRIISLALAMAMCLALGITSFAVEPPTLHQTMMDLSPGCEPNSWTNWTPYTTIQNDKYFSTLSTITITAYFLSEMGIPSAYVNLGTLVANIIAYGQPQVYYTYRYRIRVNDATMEMQQNYSLAVYSDPDRSDLISYKSDTITYPYQLNSLPNITDKF